MKQDWDSRRQMFMELLQVNKKRKKKKRKKEIQGLWEGEKWSKLKRGWEKANNVISGKGDNWWDQISAESWTKIQGLRRGLDLHSGEQSPTVPLGSWMWPLGTLISLQVEAGKGFSSPRFYFIVKQTSSLLIRRRNALIQRFPTVYVQNAHNEKQKVNLTRNTNVVPECPDSGDRRHHRREAELLYGPVQWPSFLLSSLKVDGGKVKKLRWASCALCRADVSESRTSVQGSEDDTDRGWEAESTEGATENEKPVLTELVTVVYTILILVLGMKIKAFHAVPSRSYHLLGNREFISFSIETVSLYSTGWFWKPDHHASASWVVYESSTGRGRPPFLIHDWLLTDPTLYGPHTGNHSCSGIIFAMAELYPNIAFQSLSPSPFSPSPSSYILSILSSSLFPKPSRVELMPYLSMSTQPFLFSQPWASSSLCIHRCSPQRKALLWQSAEFIFGYKHTI